jgi:hypothetical protein
MYSTLPLLARLCRQPCQNRLHQDEISARTRLPEGAQFGYLAGEKATLPPQLTQTQRTGRNTPKMIAFEAALARYMGIPDESSQTVRT